MPTVQLPATTAPVFPDRCLLCGREAPGDHAEVTARLNGMSTGRSAAGPRRVEVPACPGCKARVVRQRWAGKLLLASGVAVSATVVLGLSELGPEEDHELWFWLAMALAVLVPMGLVLNLHVAPFDLTLWDERVIYEFRSADYAAAFAELNGAEVS